MIVYTTGMGIVRKTFTDCANVKQILKTLLVKYEERDIFMSNIYQQELRDRLQCDEIQVPQLFVDGQYVGVSDLKYLLSNLNPSFSNYIYNMDKSCIYMIKRCSI